MQNDILAGDVVQTRKPHPCGNDTWEVIRTGADIKIRCLRCSHVVLMSRETFLKRRKAVVSRGSSPYEKKPDERIPAPLGNDKKPAKYVEFVAPNEAATETKYVYKDMNKSFTADYEKQLKKAGLDGIEVFYPAHTIAAKQNLLSLAQKYGLLCTAGSDYHGPCGGRVKCLGMLIPQTHYNKLVHKLFDK